MTPSPLRRFGIDHLAGGIGPRLRQEFLGNAELGMASGTGGMIVNMPDQIGARYYEGSFRDGWPEGTVMVEEPGRNPRIREFRNGFDVGKGDERQLQLLEF